MKKVLLVLGVLLSLGMFCACSNSDDLTEFTEVTISGTDMESTLKIYNQWVLVSYGNESSEVLKEAKGYYYLITFHRDGTYSGKAYGNEIGGNFQCNGKEIQFVEGDITQLDVVGADPDKFFLEHLSDVYTYTITDTELRLYYTKDLYFKFRINNDLL